MTLSPCPFKNDGVSHNLTVAHWMGGKWWYSVRCSCGAEGPKAEFENIAIAAWNLREEK